MVSSEEHNSIYDIKISTVSAGFISGHNACQELTEMDLAMKLHYLRFVYYFTTPAFEGLTIINIKETMFNWLNYAYIPCGRFRRSDSGRPYIKCNDSGVRIIEAKCRVCLDEWLESKDGSRHKLLVPNQVLGPDLNFSPLVMIQLTDFKCGGKSVGMTWSHVLGDTFSAVGFMNLWSQVFGGHYPARPLTMAQQQARAHDTPIPDPLSVKRVGPVGDLWSTSNSSEMETFSFHISTSELTQLQAKIYQEKVDKQIPVFECICVVIWQSLANCRDDSGPKVVTICKNDLKNRTKGIITNESQDIRVVKTNISANNYEPFELASLIMNNVDDERVNIKEAMGNDKELPDFLIYGANLTFVDLSDASFYDMEIRGQKPIYVSCIIDNIGDEGVVLVLPRPKGCSDGRIVRMTLPQNQVMKFKSALKEDWRIG
ncbi:HXXXD-type acyl-transferase family protein [Artemisia annua]|uniref:HXXXD-type acyl-transferase family protein n=1 Tax=Artemisia annua TaxID=35608 RepID=A0A2U1ML22_ARTAN|nr:HXXXD-type acyl-transferase family protein [Artemisia annua]